MMRQSLPLLVALLATPATSAEYFWFEAPCCGGNITVDPTGHEAHEQTTTKIRESLAKSEHGLVVEQVLKPEAYPPFLRDRKTFQGLSAAGVVDLDLDKVEVSDGCSNLTVRIGTKQKGTSGGLARFDGKFPKSATLRVVDDRKSPKDVGVEAFVESVYAALVAGLQPKEREEFAKAKMVQRLRFAPGKFPLGATWLAWISVTEQDGSVEKSYIAAALLDVGGKIVKTLYGPKFGQGDGIGGWSPTFITDVDADGVEEIVTQWSYYEGGAVYLIGWDKATKALKQSTLNSGGC